MSRQGIVKLSDFGLAKEPTFEPHGREYASEFRGKPHYVSPEVVAGQGADARSDLFSFGAMLYEMLCGDTPFGSETKVAQLRAMLDKTWHIPPLPDEVPDDLRALTMGLLRRHPHERDPQTAAHAREMLREPLDPIATRNELARVFDSIYKRHNEARTMRERGSLTGIRINAMHLADGTIRHGPARVEKKRHTRHGLRGVLRQTATALIAVAAIGGLILGMYRFRERGGVIATAPETTKIADSPDRSSTEPTKSEPMVAETMATAIDENATPPTEPIERHMPSHQTTSSTAKNLHTTRARPTHERQRDETQQPEQTAVSPASPARSQLQGDVFSEFQFERAGWVAP